MQKNADSESEFGFNRHYMEWTLRGEGPKLQTQNKGKHEMKDKPQVGDHSKWDFPDEVWDWMRRQSQTLSPEDEEQILRDMEKDGFDWEAWGDSACADEMVSEMSEEEKRLCREDPLKYFGID